MDMLKIGGYIKRLRKEAGLTQKDIADKLCISFQAVSKWESGSALPDVGILLDLCDILNTTAEKLLCGGNIVIKNRKPMHVQDVITGFENMEDIGRCFGKESDFYTGMIEGINNKMNIDLLDYMSRRDTLEVLWAEVLIQGILSGRSVDIDEVESYFTNQKMINEIQRYMEKTEPKTE